MPGPTWVMLEGVRGARADVRAKVVDFNDTGVRIELSLALKPNHIVGVKGQLIKGRTDSVVPYGRARARVVDCRPISGGGYTVGLTFLAGETATDKADEKTRRRGILELLYTVRRSRPSRAAMSIQELQEMLGGPREHLEFNLWYLQENDLIACSANAHYSITAKGVDQTEANDVLRIPNNRLIAAGD